MDESIRAIIPTIIPIVVGAILGFLSSFFSNKSAMKQQLKALALPKQMESAQNVAVILFRTLSGETIEEKTWDAFISSCYWLPESVQSKCLSVLNKKDIESAKSAQASIIKFCHSLMKGE